MGTREYVVAEAMFVALTELLQEQLRWHSMHERLIPLLEQSTLTEGRKAREDEEQWEREAEDQTRMIRESSWRLWMAREREAEDREQREKEAEERVAKEQDWREREEFGEISRRDVCKKTNAVKLEKLKLSDVANVISQKSKLSEKDNIEACLTIFQKV